MFEFEGITAIHAIPLQLKLLYYGILLVIYFLFLRVGRNDKITTVILLVFFHGFFVAFGARGSGVFRIIMLGSALNLYFGRGKFPVSPSDYKLMLSFIMFSITHFLVYFYHAGVTMSAFYEYYKLLLPFLLFVGIRKHPHWIKDHDFYINLVLKLTIFQIVFSFVKLVTLGFRENIIGSVADTGGSISIAFSVFPALIYWMNRNEQLKRDDLRFILSVLIIPIMSNKRAIWLIYPFVIMAMSYKHIEKKTLSKLAYILILIPLVFYFGLRFNPSFNPEGALWGSYDPQYAWDYIKSYTLGEGRDTQGLAYGRLAAVQMTFSNIKDDPMTLNAILGYGTGISGSYSNVSYQDLGFFRGTMAAFAFVSSNYGYLYFFTLLFLFMRFTAYIPDKYNRRIVNGLILWNLFTYSGGFVLVPQQSAIMIFTVLAAEAISRRVLELPAQIENVTLKGITSR